MSDVEKFWAAASVKFGTTCTWHELPPQEQMRFVMAINMLIESLSK